MTIALRTVLSVIVAGSLQAAAAPAGAAGVRATAPPPAPNPDMHYQLGPDSYPRDGVPKGDVRGPFTLPSEAYPGTQHTYWIYVPAQYDAKVPASLMIFNDGQAFKNMDGDLRAPNVLDNLIYRREIPVMVAVFINPGRRPDQPEPTPQNWGDRDTNRPTEYNTLDDKYARVVVDELMPALYKDYNISKDPERHAIGGASSGAIAAFTVAWQRPDDVPESAQHRRQLHEPARRPRLRRHRPQQREEAAARLSAGRTQRQPRRRPRGDVRRDVGLVPSEQPADARAVGQGLRPQLHVGHRAARPEAGRGDPARHDALAVARSSGVHRSERRGRARLQRAREQSRDRRRRPRPIRRSPNCSRSRHRGTPRTCAATPTRLPRSGPTRSRSSSRPCRR